MFGVCLLEGAAAAAPIARPTYARVQKPRLTVAVTKHLYTTVAAFNNNNVPGGIKCDVSSTSALRCSPASMSTPILAVEKSSGSLDTWKHPSHVKIRIT